MASTLVGKRDLLLQERKTNRAQRAELAARDREIDRALADIQAAGRVFGVEIKIPRDVDDGARAGFILPPLNIFGEDTVGVSDHLRSQIPPLVTKAEMPRISDLVLDQLKKAAKSGIKARCDSRVH